VFSGPDQLCLYAVQHNETRAPESERDWTRRPVVAMPHRCGKRDLRVTVRYRTDPECSDTYSLQLLTSTGDAL